MVKAAWWNWGESIVIERDGNIYPSDAPVERDGSRYVLTDDVIGGLEIYADNVVVDFNVHYVGSNLAPQFYVKAENVTVMNGVVNGTGYGSVYLSEDVRIVNMSFMDGLTLYVSNSSGVVLENVSFRGEIPYDYVFLRVENSFNMSINNVDIIAPYRLSDTHGIMVSGSSNVRVKDVSVESVGKGIRVKDSSGVVVEHASVNGETALYIDGSNNVYAGSVEVNSTLALYVYNATSVNISSVHGLGAAKIKYSQDILMDGFYTAPGLDLLALDRVVEQCESIQCKPLRQQCVRLLFK